MKKGFQISKKTSETEAYIKRLNGLLDSAGNKEEGVAVRFTQLDKFSGGFQSFDFLSVVTSLVEKGNCRSLSALMNPSHEKVGFVCSAAIRASLGDVNICELIGRHCKELSALAKSDEMKELLKSAVAKKDQIGVGRSR